MKSMAIIFFASVMFLACGDGSSNASGNGDPREVAEKFYKAIMSYDYDEVAKYCSKESLQSFEEAKKQINNIPADQLNTIKETAKMAKVETGEAKISEDGKSATVDLKVSIMGMENIQPIKLVKEGNDWKVTQ